MDGGGHNYPATLSAACEAWSTHRDHVSAGVFIVSAVTLLVSDR